MTFKDWGSLATPARIFRGTEASRLAALMAAGGLGDWGASQNCVWDGAQLRLVAATAMGECGRGSKWLPVWRADTRS